MNRFKNRIIIGVFCGVILNSFLAFSNPTIQENQEDKPVKSITESSSLGVESSTDSSFETGNALFKQGKFQEAINAFKKGGDNPANLMGIATSQRFMGDYSNAIDSYSSLINKKYNLGESYFGRAMSYRGQEEFSKAIKDFKQSLEYRKDEYTYAGIGDLLLLTGKNGEAREILEQGAKEFPNSEIIKKLLVRAYKY